MATSPGIHLGHYKSLITEPMIPKKADAAKPDLTVTKTLLSTLAWHSFEHWKLFSIWWSQRTNCKIHQFCIIYFCTADRNFILGIKWREALHYLEEDNQLLNESMYSSRPGQSTHKPIFLQVLQHKIYCISRKKGVHHDNNASSCYDFILASVTLLTSEKYDINTNVARIKIITLEQAKFWVKTSHCISQ